MEAERIGRRRKWRSFKERLALIGCCASGWGIRASNPTVATLDDDEAEEYGVRRERREGAAAAAAAAAGTVEEMNLASALAAERLQHRAASAAAAAAGEQDEAPLRMSLMRLLVEADERREGEGGGDGGGGCGCGGGGAEGWCWCCVCVGRRKGAAFIPCGHTFCRVCSRELWLNRGACPLCNRPIVDILDIF